MTPLELAQRMKGLPEAVLDHLYSEDVADLNDSVIRRNAISDLQLRTLFGLLQELFVKNVLPEQLVDEIKKRFGFDDAKARQLALDVAGYRLLPLDKYLGDVDSLIRSLGGDPEKYPKTRVVIERRTPEVAAEDVIRASAVEATDPLLHDRLKDALVSFYAGIRTEPQVLESLQRPKKVGGMAYDEATAARVLSAAKEEARSVVIAKEEAPAPPKPAPPQAGGVEAPAPAKAPETFVTVRPEDEKEIADLKANASVPAKSDETAARIAASVDELYGASGLATDDEERAKRVKTVIASRLRDVRDSMETLETLVQPQALGGLGLSQDDARKLLSLIDAKLEAVHASHVAEVAKKKETWVGKAQVEAGQVETSAKTAQQLELERLYRSIVDKNQAAAPPQAPAVPAAPKADAPPNLPVADGAVPGPVPVPAAAPVIATLVRPAAAVGAPVQVRPKMEDVKASPQLTGPVEELRQLTIVDFRRMSKDPAEACAKIKGKIDLLADQSFTKRNQGIAAWSSSEIHRTYLEMMGEALAGTPMKDVIVARQTARKPVLSAEETQALAALSRQLRY